MKTSNHQAFVCAFIACCSSQSIPASVTLSARRPKVAQQLMVQSSGVVSDPNYVTTKLSENFSKLHSFSSFLVLSHFPCSYVVIAIIY